MGYIWGIVYGSKDAIQIGCSGSSIHREYSTDAITSNLVEAPSSREHHDG